MDSISSYEFHQIFHRTVQDINLKGKFTEEEIEKELIRVRNLCDKLSEKAERRKTQLIYRRKKVELEKLIENGFARRVIAEARARPRGIVALTLTFGYGEAKRRLLAQARTRKRMRLIRRNRRSLL